MTAGEFIERVCYVAKIQARAQKVTHPEDVATVVCHVAEILAADRAVDLRLTGAY